jgi:hypothetical protein
LQGIGGGDLRPILPGEAVVSPHDPCNKEYVDPKQLRPGPIRNESLPTELPDQIKAVFDVMGRTSA